VAGYAGTPIASFSVERDGPNGEITAGADGHAELSGIEPGRHTLRLTAPGFLPERLTFEVAEAATAQLSVALLEAVPKLDELVVTASRYDVGTPAQPSATYFSRDEIESLASLGDDTVRVAHRLPGVANNEFSARSYVRGGAANELAVLLDGVRLAEPFHLRDLQAVFSAIDQRIVDTVAMHAGGFPTEYGDALSGLMIVEPREPTALAHELGASVLYTSLLSSGVFAGERASWLVSARNSNLDRVLADDLGEPAYSDAFMRVTAELSARHRLSVGSLRFRDDVFLTLQDEPDDQQRAASDTDSRQAWVKLDSEWNDKLSSSTWAYVTQFESSRRERVADLDELVGAVDDRRELELAGLKQVWRYRPSDRQQLSAGFEAEDVEASYRYSSAVQRSGLLATLGGTAPPFRDATLAPAGDSYGAYVEDRVRFTDRLVADIGVRWDRQTYLPPGVDSQFSPRASLLYRVAERTDLRVSHGRFFQAEGMLDLQVEDGVTEFSRAQRAAHSIVSVEHRFSGTLALRAELYYNRTRDVRPRYENLYQPLVLVPELRSSRVRIAPERAESRGVEVFVAGERPVSWWAGLSVADVADEIGGEQVARSWDQRHALHAGVTWPIGPWSVSTTASLHSGWPATEIGVTTSASGEAVAVAGPRNGIRLRDFRRLDLRASRDFDVGFGSLRFFAEVTNLTNRDNPCCLVYEPTTVDGMAALAVRERSGAAITGNLGVLWQF
jgi:outer membrane receptor protein involved in Fe transport